MPNDDIATLLSEIIAKERIKSSLIDLVAYASDAGFYYLRPKAVVLPIGEEEIINLFRFSRTHQIPLVFRTAGTSLSGQSITDGILVDLSQHWAKITVENDGQFVRVQPGAIGSIVNSSLYRFGKKIGPDPASINSAMMGGIISNNASGMCCGVSKNSYHTVKYIRFILPDGKTYSTENSGDYARFSLENPSLAEQLIQIREQILNSSSLYELIRKKYKTKNTVGYSVNAFIDFGHPLDILAHLLIGAEGTLAFIAEAVLETLPDYKAKSTTLLYFPDIYSACKAIVPLTNSGAAAVELMDRASLRSVEHIEGLPTIIRELPESAAALLVEYQGNSQEEIALQIADFIVIAAELNLLNEALFTTDPTEQALFWKVRKGMFPAVGAVRASGTSVILEDIAVPVDKLGDAIIDLQQLFVKYQYNNAIIFGHAKDGNIHFVISQAFDTPSEIERYDRLLKDVINLVLQKYGGALKAEHGTGRNMAPFVEKEWGGEIYEMMKTIKAIVDPQNLLNPGVIINNNPDAHLANLKELPKVEVEVDRCMECGFCEHVCPSRDITLTPRKRIVVRRELLNLKNKGKKQEYKTLLDQYQYQGLDTCAVDGLCATACPVDINTGDLVKRLRRENHSPMANRIALLVAKNFNGVAKTVKFALASGELLNRVFGNKTMTIITGGIKTFIPSFPLWSDQLATAKKVPQVDQFQVRNQSVVYFPTCITRLMGDKNKGDKDIMQNFLSVSEKAGIQVIIPAHLNQHCCGQLFSSKGFASAFAHAANETIEKLFETTLQGAFPIVLDISSCTQTLTNCSYVLSEENREKFNKLTIIDSVAYLHDYILPNVAITKKKDSIALHPVCSLQKMAGLPYKFNAIANRFAKEVTQPLFAGCCGMAGDRGFLFPELTKSATHKEAKEVKAKEHDGFYSSSKTCEIALSDAVGKDYHSILKLVDECSAQLVKLN
jgi:D-lactate dehydrogenase